VIFFLLFNDQKILFVSHPAIGPGLFHACQGSVQNIGYSSTQRPSVPAAGWTISLQRLNIAFYRFDIKSFVNAPVILTLNAFAVIL